MGRGCGGGRADEAAGMAFVKFGWALYPRYIRFLIFLQKKKKCLGLTYGKHQENHVFSKNVKLTQGKLLQVLVPLLDLLCSRDPLRSSLIYGPV